MAESKKRQYTAQEKVKIVLALLKGENTQNELTSRYGIHAPEFGDCSAYKYKLT